MALVPRAAVGSVDPMPAHAMNRHLAVEDAVDVVSAFTGHYARKQSFAGA